MDNLNSLSKTVNAYSSLIFKIGILLVIASSFFLFTNFFTEVYDAPKFLILIAFTAIFLILLALRFTVTGKVVFIRTPLDIPLLLLMAVAIVSTFLSPAQSVSLLGNQLHIHGSLVAIVTYVLFYFILVNGLKDAREIKWLFSITTVIAQILAIVTLMAYFGLKVLPSPWTHGTNFTPTGASFSTAAILALLLPFIVVRILSAKKPLSTVANSLFLALSGITIALTGNLSTWIAAMIGLLIMLLIINPAKTVKFLTPVKFFGLATPVVLIILTFVLSLIPPMGKAVNPLYTKAQSFPQEIQLPFISSWKISVSSFRDIPLWGSGPATYLFDFTNYKPVEFNAGKFWSLRFDSSFNEYLQVLATLGGIGILALISLTALFASSAYQTISQHRKESRHLQTSNLSLPTESVALAVSGITFFVILLLHTSTLPLWVFGTIVLASFMKINLSETLSKHINSPSDFKNMFLRIAANVTSRNSEEETIKIDALPGVLLVVILALVAITAVVSKNIILADYHHRLALNAVAQNNGVLAYNELVKTEGLNPKIDVYHTDLAQTNFALANAIAAAKGPTEASPGGSLTDQDKQTIQVLLQQSINEGRLAVNLSPKSAVNWEILAQLYRQISGVAQNALVFSLDSYGRAILQDPLNPNLRLAVGGVYYAAKNYDMAIRFFSDAINLKPDFANAYYNLSVALKDKGDLAGAQAAAEKVLTLIDSKSADYKTISDYLTDLKTKAESNAQPPAAKETEALQQKELPKVVNVGNPPKDIATPSAVKKPNTTPEPAATPTVKP